MRHPRRLSALGDNLAGRLKRPFNNTVEIRIIPEDKKSATVTSIHK